jgi:T-complex protein 1 subunit eta
MDKLIHNQRSVTISNDGATIIGLLEIVHPAAKTLVDIAKSQDNEVGDGTTSVTIFAGELLKESKQFIEEGMHASVIIKGYREAMTKCVERIKEVSIKIADAVKQFEMIVTTDPLIEQLKCKVGFFGIMILGKSPTKTGLQTYGG